jgi:hypothetical protein
VTIDHEISDRIGRIRLGGDVVSQQDANLLIVIVGDHVRDVRCFAIEIDMIAVMDVSSEAVGALTALKGMASIHGKSLSVVGSHGEVRTKMERAGLLPRDASSDAAIPQAEA